MSPVLVTWWTDQSTGSYYLQHWFFVIFSNFFYKFKKCLEILTSIFFVLRYLWTAFFKIILFLENFLKNTLEFVWFLVKLRLFPKNLVKNFRLRFEGRMIYLKNLEAEKFVRLMRISIKLLWRELLWNTKPVFPIENPSPQNGFWIIFAIFFSLLRWQLLDPQSV